MYAHAKKEKRDAVWDASREITDPDKVKGSDVRFDGVEYKRGQEHICA